MPSRPRRRSRSTRSRKRATRRPQLTSLPTSRTAYADTRAWLLKEHGPVCAYCGRVCSPRTITLDHVTPRRGQSAYDRRDNLVLACKRCNAAKADKPFVAYILADRKRAANLLHYGAHLSEGILSILRPIAATLPPSVAAPPAPAASRAAERPARRQRHVFGPDDDGESPYRDAESPYRRTA